MDFEFRSYIHALMTDQATGLIASVIKFFLYLLSLIYALCIKGSLAIREKGLLPTSRLEGRVISVGNITVGGTGKTPLVEFVARRLHEGANKVVILTRGYKIFRPKEEIVAGEKAELFEEIGDEPALLKRRIPQVPIMVGSDRIKNGRIAIQKYGADVLLLDDGFQCWALSRDVDIVLVDSNNPFGNGRLLPRGILREPVSHLVRADVIVLTKTDIVAKEKIEALKRDLKSYNPDALIVSCVHKPSRLSEVISYQDFELDWLKGKRICAMAGIGDPVYFQKVLESLGAMVGAKLYFPDHHPYSFKDIDAISKMCMETSIDIVITTEKDAVRLKPLLDRHALALESFQLKFFVLGINIEITENLDKFIDRLKPAFTKQR